MFDELNIRTTHVDGEDYVNVSDLASHLTMSMLAMQEEIKADRDAKNLDDLGYNFCVGIIYGMREIALLLAQGGIEMKMDREVQTLDDLMNFG